MEEKPTRILVAVDGSDSSLAALQRGATIAGALHVPIEAITTWEYPVMVGGFYVAETWSPEKDAQEILSTAIERAFHGSPPADLTSRIVQGSAARVLIDESAHASMLILGSRGLGGFAGLLLGSVSLACAQHARCPVLIMREPITR